MSSIKLVLDTNVVLDWLVFAEPLLQPLEQLHSGQRLKIVAYSATLAELQRVLAYAALQLSDIQQSKILCRYQLLVDVEQSPNSFGSHNLQLPAGFPICSDTDDQLFLALAFHTQASALVSRDKAVLKLRKRASKFGVTIIDVAQLSQLLQTYPLSLP